jgi:hypothetical protein
MAWLEFHVDLKGTLKALTRIADALDRLTPIPAERPKPRQARFIQVEPYAIAEAEEEADRQKVAGTQDDAQIQG